MSGNTEIVDSPTEKIVMSGATQTGPRMIERVKARVIQSGRINTPD